VLGDCFEGLLAVVDPLLTMLLPLEDGMGGLPCSYQTIVFIRHQVFTLLLLCIMAVCAWV
jgi:hypothetical protein